MMRALLSFLLLLSVTSCVTRKKTYQGDWVKKIDSPEMTYLVQNYAAEMFQEYGMELEDSKIHYTDDIEKIQLKFKSQQIVDMCEARKLMVDMIENLLTRVNEHSLLAFQLSPQPFSASQLEFTINFESFFTEYVDPLYIGVVCLRDGVMYYFAGNIKNFRADWSAQRIEPYYKSLEIVAAQEEAELQYADLEEYEGELQPHPFLFGKYVPIENGARSRNGPVRKDPVFPESLPYNEAVVPLS